MRGQPALPQNEKRICPTQLPGSGAYSPVGILADFEDGLGTLRAYSKSGDDISSTVIAENVPIQTQTVENTTGRRLFVADSEDGAVGSLYVTNEPTLGSSAPLRARKIADDVFVESARFLEQPHSVAYLARREGSDFVTLKVWLLESELTITVHQAVSEYRTVPWPAPGILYAVPTGDDEGLWFSKAR